MSFVTAALALGFLGSFHCIGMCGPLALMLPVQGLSGPRKVMGILLYNLGRVSTYALLGLLMGFIGKQVALAGWQQILSIALGTLLLSSLILHQMTRQLPKVQFWQKQVKRRLVRLLQEPKISTLFQIGLLNGMLPCGLVYVAIAGALAVADWKEGMLFMVLFGFGTVPAMMALNFFGHLLSVTWRSRLQAAIPYAIAFMGLLLLLRGLNLGIPGISPKLTQTQNRPMIQCCHPKN
jgi:sulfite exporter TauE/SafE